MFFMWKKRSADKAEAKRLVESGATKVMPLHDFEEACNITEINRDRRRAGRPASTYYKLLTPSERKRKQEVVDRFVETR